MTAACVLQVQYRRANTICEKSEEAYYFHNYWIISSAASLLASKIFTVGNIQQLSADPPPPRLPLFLPLYILQLVTSLPFNIPKAWSFPFQAEPLHIGPYREYTLGSWLILFPHSEPIWLHDRRSNNVQSIKTYFASSINAIRPEAIAVAADVASKFSMHPDFWSAEICGIG